MSGRLNKKVIIVTGGAGLIGRSIVKRCEDEGAIVINIDIANDTDIQKGTFGCDLTVQTEVVELVKQINQFYGRIDGLVNNAYPRTSDWDVKIEDIPYESWQKNVDMQLNATFFLSQQVLNIMTTQGSGAIVNMGSIYGVVGNDFTIYEEYGGTSPAAYSAIKGGIINLTRYLASYYGKQGIRINSVSPGGIKDNQHPSFIERYEKRSPLGRLGQPEEIAPGVCFLLSDESSYITGHNLMIDGGWTAI